MTGHVPLINRVINFSAIDGPGNRLVIFFQGCNFRCLNCHNPQTMGRCVGIKKCGQCIQRCPQEALKSQEGQGLESGGTPVHEPEGCVGCDLCQTQCPHDSDPRAQAMTPREVVETHIRPAAPFISGITLSGGEASLYPGFIRALRQILDEEDRHKTLTLYLDSNGSPSRSRWEAILPAIHGVMIDMKAFTPEVHRQITGVRNERILGSIYYLQSVRKLWEVRVLIIPGYNDSEKELASIRSFLYHNARGARIRLIPYRTHGVRAPYHRIPEPEAEFMEQVASYFEDWDFQVYSIIGDGLS